MLVTQALDMHQWGRGARSSWIFSCLAPLPRYLLQCPLSSPQLHRKAWKGLEGLGSWVKPHFRKDFVSLTKGFLFNLLLALPFGDEYEN